MDIEIKQVQKRPVIGIRRQFPLDQVGDFIRETFEKVGPYFSSNGMEMTGPPVAIFFEPPNEGMMDTAAGAPVTKVTATTDEIIELELSEGKVATALYIGPYEGIANAWEEMMSVISKRGEKTVEPCWEECFFLRHLDECDVGSTN
ncbi:MAG: GyrI-like domain-containing protein [Chloroflexi bacterium]|jgi:effector-binding domain-containing protein|nr:GyrI-like domain-containing protein [Chloroflexota bacterium]